MGGSTVADRSRLGHQRLIDWRSVMSAGWRILVEQHRPVAAEVAATHRMLVPLVPAGARQASSTPTDAFGCVAMTLPPNPLCAALTLAHEVQHAKLSVLTDLVPLVDDDGVATFYAPWRPDPRPALALLHGVYAHLGVAAFWQAQYKAGGNPAAEVEFVRWRTATEEAAEALLGSGRLTRNGTRLVETILAVMAGWRSDVISATSASTARRLVEHHRDRWHRANGP
jgi:HEXXH motif-containing protein